MKYLVLVSHGEFAAGLKTSLMMLAGQRDDVIASGLPDGKTADEFAEIFKESVKDIHEDDEIVLLADIVGGSPLTTALNVLAEKRFNGKDNNNWWDEFTISPYFSINERYFTRGFLCTSCLK